MGIELPKPFNSRKFWTASVGIGALVALAMTGHDSGQATGAIATLAGGGTLAQGLIDLKQTGVAKETPGEEPVA